MKVVVIDPRRTMTADIADLHLAIRPDGDVALFTGLLAHLIAGNAVDQNYIAEHTSGFTEAFAAAFALCLQRSSGSDRPAGNAASRVLSACSRRPRRSSPATARASTSRSSGTDKVNAIINCHLATGRIGRPGMGPFSLTGQPNAMGGREVGGLANMLAAHMAIENAEDRDRVQRFWQCARQLPTSPA